MYDNIGIKKQAIFLLILLLIVVVSVDYQQSPPTKPDSTQEITVEQQEERYADALELAKQGQWESCYNKINIGEIKNPIDKISYLSSYALAQMHYAKGTEEGYQKAWLALKRIPDSYEWEFKDGLIGFRQSAQELYESMKATREAKEAQEKAAEAEKRKPPIVISDVWMTRNSIGVPEIHVVVTNQKERPVNAFTFDVEAFDGYDRQLSKFGFGDEVAGCIYQNSTLNQGESSPGSSYWTLNGFTNGRKFKVRIRDCHFTDGGTWTADSQNDSATEVSF